jgi:hypothetical protein
MGSGNLEEKVVGWVDWVEVDWMTFFPRSLLIIEYRLTLLL